MLQYTSGSTGAPSGIAITHGNLVDNQMQMARSFEHADDTVVVTWLPMFHDMGLGAALIAVWTGRPCIVMSPSVFIQNPRRWLAAISHYRGTTSLAPDFAYDLCARRIGASDREGLDLSSWRVALNGSEPVRSATLDRFVEAFGPCGFRREAFLPAYGLAEATMFATSDGVDEPPRVAYFSKDGLARGEAVPARSVDQGQPLVSCGHPWLGSRLSIIDPETLSECPPGRVGEIWLRGGSVGVGYWKKELESRYTFEATTADGQGPFLRTGDLGFSFNGRLFISGRLKDLIIIRGKNHCPQDIEDSVSTCHPALTPRRCAAFSVDSDDGEKLVVVQEVERTALRTLDVAGVMRAIRAVVSEHHALQTHAIVLTKPATVPRTTSGKIRRGASRRAFLDRSLSAVASWGPGVGPVAPEHGAEGSQRSAAQRADRVIEWLRLHAAELIATYSEGERRELSPALLAALARQGLLGMLVDTTQGGLGLRHFDTTRVLEQIAAVDFSLSLLIGAHTYLGVEPIARHASDSVRALLLSRLAQGQEIVAFGFSESDEPRAGAPVRLLGDEPWHLAGVRELYSASSSPTLLNVLACSDEPPNVSAFVVEARSAGVSLVDDGRVQDTLGLARCRVWLDTVAVTRQSALGAFGRGDDVARDAMRHMRLAIGAACVGAMKRCAQLVSRNGRQHSLDGKATPNPVVLSRLGAAAARVTALECLVYSIAGAVDRGQPVPAEAFGACKLLGPEMLLRSIDDLMLIGVKAGRLESNQVLDIYREAASLRYFTGAPESLAEATGAAVMADDAPLRLLLGDVLGAPDVVSWVDPITEAVGRRMQNLDGAPGRRAARWGHTRAGELTSWLALLAAVQGRCSGQRSPELAHAHAWTLAQLEHAVSAARLGTPSETATLVADDIAATFATYARTIGDLEPDSSREVPSSRPRPVQSGTSGRVGSNGHAVTAGVDQERGSARERDAKRRELRARIISWIASRLGIPIGEVEPGRSFADHGLDSVASVELAKTLSDGLGRELDATVVWSFATIDALAEFLARPQPEAPPAAASASERVLDTSLPERGKEASLDESVARLEQELGWRS
jgi:acyl-CoA synthetase (AMP-forming)/AMP-acid ligase II/alkylation response protein AidB-like acyl-CoA dehydrogenase/acyl carrier protein